MPDYRRFFRDAGPVILQMERQAPWSRLDARQFRTLALTGAALALGLGLVTWGRVKVYSNSYEIVTLRQERDRLADEHLRLQRRIEEMQTRDYAETVARGQLGMVDINPNQVIVLKHRSAAGDLAESVKAFFGAGEQPERPAHPSKR
jgi:cell division protein FtsB